MKKIFTAKLLLVCLLAIELLISSACAPQNVAPAGSTANSAQIKSAPDNAVANKAKTGDPAQLSAPRRVSFQTPDKVEIIGTFYQSQASGNAPAVLMLHQWGATRASYDEFAKKLQTDGINVLTIDGRGFGESIRQGEQKIAPGRTDAAVAGMLSDVAAAVRFLEQQISVDANRIGIIGASYGSSLAIIYAANNPQIKAVALLSPGTNYFGNLATEEPIQKYGSRSLLLVAAEDDAESAVAARRLNSLANGDKHQLAIFKQGGHGTALFAADANLESLLGKFLVSNL